MFSLARTSLLAHVRVGGVRAYRWGAIGQLRIGEEMRRNRRLDKWTRDMFGEMLSIKIDRSAKQTTVNITMMQDDVTPEEIDKYAQHASLFGDYMSMHEEEAPVRFVFHLHERPTNILTSDIYALDNTDGWELATAREINGCLSDPNPRAQRLAIIIRDVMLEWPDKMPALLQLIDTQFGHERFLSAQTVGDGVGGYKIQLKGRMQALRGGSDRKSIVKIGQGTMPKKTLRERKNIDYGAIFVRTEYGMVSVKTWIHKVLD